VVNEMNFLPDSFTLLQFISAVVVISLIPGPDMTLFVSRTLAQGRSAGFACMMGTSSGIIIHVMGVVLGLSALIVAAPHLFFWLKVAGAAYLLWLAVGALCNKSPFQFSHATRGTARFWQNYFTGLATNLLNPKIILFNMTFLPQFVRSTDPHASSQLLFLGLSFIPISLILTVPMILAADHLSRFLRTKPQIMRWLDWLMASLFTTFAVRLIFTTNK